MTTTDLAVRNGAAIAHRPTQLSTERLGEILVKSGFFKDTRDQAQAIVKVLAGSELGFGPIASMQGVYIVEGKVTLSAQLIASAIQKSGKYDYRVKAWDANACTIEFRQGREALGVFTFDMDDAKRANLAGKGPWRSYPKAMLWARAMSAGARAYCPEVFNGAVYTPEELGAEVDEDGHPLRVVDTTTGEVIEDASARPEPTPKPSGPRMVTSARDEIMQRYAGLIEAAAALDIPYETVELPVEYARLVKLGKALADKVATTREQIRTAGIVQDHDQDRYEELMGVEAGG